MTATEFFAWAENWEEGEQCELIDGRVARLQSEQVSHAETKLTVVIALRDGLRQAGLNTCRAFTDGVSVKINDRFVRVPDALVHYGPYDRSRVYVPNPVIVVEVVSPSSIRTDVTRKLIDYFEVPSILHYIVVYARDGRVVHYRRESAEGTITTAILGRDALMEFTPLAFSVAVNDFLGDGEIDEGQPVS